jgi:hypothetical protein
MRTRDLVELASAIIRSGNPDGFDFTYSGYEMGNVARHPYDDGVWLGDIGALRSLPEGVDAVVSLCRVGNADLSARTEQIDVRLIDPGVNDNLDFVLLDTVRVVEQLRGYGRTVLIQCVQAQSRTPNVATLYGARLRGMSIPEAFGRRVWRAAQRQPEPGVSRGAATASSDSTLHILQTVKAPTPRGPR